MPFTYIRRAAVALALTLLTTAGCTVKNTEVPPLTGPSGLALTLTVNAIPDSISQDGGSQSSVRVTAIGPDGKPISGLPLRMDMSVNGVAADFGTLSARSIVTNGDGVATVVYTAPPAPPNGIFTPCASGSGSSSLPGSCVSIVATATATNFSAANPESVLIRLVPTGVILPPPVTPTAAFTFSPTPVNLNVPVIFDGSASCGGPLNGTACTSTSTVTTWTWNFGDGTSGSGKTVTHSFSGSGTSFNVTLTVTNERGVSNSTSQTVGVSASAPPKADFTFSPRPTPTVGDTVFFNADISVPTPGHPIVQFSWNFGDGGTASGLLTTHVFATAGTYAVVLSVLDDAGQKNTKETDIAIGTGSPTAVLTLTKTGGLLSVLGDASASSASGGATITNYTFLWGDGTTTNAGSSSAASHTYPVNNTYSVTLRVTDSLGRVGNSAPQSVTVP
jgi:PKD repeat protein